MDKLLCRGEMLTRRQIDALKWLASHSGWQTGTPANSRTLDSLKHRGLVEYAYDSESNNYCERITDDGLRALSAHLTRRNDE